MENTSQIRKPKVERKRHIAKAITWRIIGTIDTWLISYILVYYIGDTPEKATEAASYIAGLELITKTILYYFHERTWCSLNFGFNPRVRHIIKTISWRLVGAIDTILLVFVVYFFLFGKTEEAAEIAVSMFSIEIVTKMVLYYLHERVWYTSNWGVIKAENQSSSL